MDKFIIKNKCVYKDGEYVGDINSLDELLKEGATDFKPMKKQIHKPHYRIFDNKHRRWQ